MGKFSNRAVPARERARERFLRVTADRARRDERIVAATEVVIAGIEKLDQDKSAAQTERNRLRGEYEQALAKVDKAEATAVAKTEPVIAAALGRLQVEKLSLAEVADLAGLPSADVRRLLKLADNPPATLQVEPANRGGGESASSGLAGNSSGAMESSSRAAGDAIANADDFAAATDDGAQAVESVRAAS